MKIFKYILILTLLLQPYIIATIDNKVQAATIEVLDHYELGNYHGSFADVNKQRKWVLTNNSSTYYIYNYNTGSLVTSFTASNGIISRTFRDDVDAMGSNTRMYYRRGDTIYYRDKNNITTERTLLSLSGYTLSYVRNLSVSQDRLAFYYDYDSDQIPVFNAWNGSYIHSKVLNGIGYTGNLTDIYSFSIGRDGFIIVYGKESSGSKRLLWYSANNTSVIKYNSSKVDSAAIYAADSTVYVSSTYKSSTKYHLYVYRDGTEIFYYTNTSSSYPDIKYNDETNMIYINSWWRPISDTSLTVGRVPSDENTVFTDNEGNAVYMSNFYGHDYIKYNDSSTLYLEFDPKQALLSSTDNSYFLVYLNNGDIIYVKASSAGSIYMERKTSTIHTNYYFLDYDSANNIVWALDNVNRKIVKMVASQIVTEDNVTQVINENPAINDIQNDITSINNTLVDYQNQINAKKIAPTVSFIVANTENDVSTTRNITLKARAVKPGVSLTSSNTFQYRYSMNGGSSWTGWYNWGTSYNRNIAITLPNVVGWHDVVLEVRHYVSASEIYDGGITKQLVGYDPNYQSNTELRNRVTELEKDKAAPIIYEIDTVIENKSAVDLSSEGNSIQFLIQAQDDQAALNQMKYSYRRNSGSWSSWVGIPSNGQISVYVGNGSNTYEFKVRDNASPANESLIYKFNRTIWGL